MHPVNSVLMRPVPLSCFLFPPISKPRTWQVPSLNKHLLKIVDSILELVTVKIKISLKAVALSVVKRVIVSTIPPTSGKCVSHLQNQPVSESRSVWTLFPRLNYYLNKSLQRDLKYFGSACCVDEYHFKRYITAHQR